MTLSSVLRLLAAHPVVGLGVALLIKSDLGAAPWDVFHVAFAGVSGLTIGMAAIATAIIAIAVAFALGVRPGLSTVTNAVLLGPCVDAALAILPTSPSITVSVGYLAAGIAALGLGTGLYLSARLGAGPRDSVMVALSRRPGWTLSRARIVLELSVLSIGLLLGGAVGIGTLLFALAIGPATQWGTHVFMKDSP